MPYLRLFIQLCHELSLLRPNPVTNKIKSMLWDHIELNASIEIPHQRLNQSIRNH